MTTYTFSVNNRMSVKPPPPAGKCVATALPGLPPSVIRAPPPPPPTAGQLMAMHHTLMNPARSILIGPQGLAVAPNQFFAEGIYPAPGNVTPAMISPGLNDAPLEFNLSRNKTDTFIASNVPCISDTIEIKNHVDKNSDSDSMKDVTGMNSDDDDCQITCEVKPSIESNTSHVAATTTTTPSQNLPVLTNSGVWNGVLPNVNFSMLGVNHMLASNLIDSNFFVGQTVNDLFGVFGNIVPQLPNTSASGIDQNTNSLIKKCIYCKNCTLFPPNPNAPAPTTRDRPLGCKTVFVGGLPENIKEETVREIFKFCGEITNIRLSNKKFGHIRFQEESAVDQALTLSGFRIRLGSSTEPANNGRLHVDFAHARDDQFEWECKQRQIQREQRHRERVLRENVREEISPGPSHFTESEANSVLDKLKGEDTFVKAISTAVCWLDRGECNKRNVNTFYNMIQSINSHVRRLLHDKSQCESEFKKTKEIMKSRAETVLSQFAQIEKLFVSSSHKKVWDHFTKAQRKNIELWKKTAMEIKKLSVEIDEPANDEMDLSDSDSEEKSVLKKRKLDDLENNSLKDENDSLRCQLEAYKNEICVIRSELQCEVNRKGEQIAILQSSLNNVTDELEKNKLVQMQELKENVCKTGQEADTTVSAVSPNKHLVVEKEAKLIGLISIFLHIHPFGAGVDYIYSFIQKTVPALKVTEVETVMSKFPSIFQQEFVGIGANMERKWKFTGFKSDSETSST